MPAMRLGAIVAAVVTVVAPAEAGRRAVPFPAAAATFEDPHGALAPFLGALRATEFGRADHPVRISIFGDSITADDHIVERLRAVLGARFGNGGPGFVHPIPLAMSANKGVKRWGGKGWRASGIAHPPPPDRLYGYGGAFAETKSGGTLTFRPTRTATSADVYFLEQPGGGSLEVTIDGKKHPTIATRGAKRTSGFARIDVGAPFRSLTLKARGKVKLFGVDLEGERGVVVDNVGVKNATAKSWYRIRRDHWQEQIAHRDPDLVVVLIGANEAGWLAGRAAGPDYDAVMSRMLAPVRAADAPCLVIATFDQVDFKKTKLPQRRSIAPMVASQRKAALEAGCAFWDAYAWMGGPRSSVTWVKRRWMNHDFAHPTAAGSRRIADALTRGILNAYYQRPIGPTRTD